MTNNCTRKWSWINVGHIEEVELTHLTMNTWWDRVDRGPVSQQVWHDKDPSLLRGPKRRAKVKCRSLGFTVNGDVSIWIIFELDENQYSINQFNNWFILLKPYFILFGFCIELAPNDLFRAFQGGYKTDTPSDEKLRSPVKAETFPCSISERNEERSKHCIMWQILALDANWTF